MKLIFVHGRSQQRRSADAIRSEWVGALNIGLANAGMTRLTHVPVVPFYGDELVRLAGEEETITSTEMLERAPSDDSFREFLTDFAVEASQRTPVNDDQLKRFGFEPGRVDRSRTGRAADRESRSADLEERGPQNWSWVQAIIRSLDEHFPDFSEGSISLILRDVFLYMTEDAISSKINKIVANAFDGEPAVVVGHSLGSVVAYRVLSSAPTKVARYITLGSPLAINAIKKRLQPKPRMPPHVADWYNARDRADIVALNPLTHSNFPTSPAIKNEDGINNTSDNRHHITKYLDDKRVARATGEHLSR